MLQNASIHRFAASTHYTMKKDFYFFPGLTSSGKYNGNFICILYKSHKFSSKLIPDN